jgi:predicted phosphodiesterase
MQSASIRASRSVLRVCRAGVYKPLRGALLIKKMPMKIRYFSDLHLEFTDYVPATLPSVGEDVVVLAGDIGRSTEGIEWAKSAFHNRPVLYVLGNHEFFRGHWDGLIDDARRAADGSNVQLLERDQVVINGIAFLGATLWTDFAIRGVGLRDEAMLNAEELMYDYRRIECRRGDPLRAADTAERCRQTTAWLEASIRAATLPTVVITHHSPTLSNEHPEFPGALTAAAFHSDREYLFQPPVRLWISGHTHHSAATRVNGIPLLSNQRGYPREALPFDWDACVAL